MSTEFAIFVLGAKHFDTLAIYIYTVAKLIVTVILTVFARSDAALELSPHLRTC